MLAARRGSRLTTGAECVCDALNKNRSRGSPVSFVRRAATAFVV
jgi:hypothetical protein